MFGENVTGKTLLGVDSTIKIFTENVSGEKGLTFRNHASYI
jgi:hypothetical protein